jgi:hypothetical protein
MKIRHTATARSQIASGPGTLATNFALPERSTGDAGPGTLAEANEILRIKGNSRGANCWERYARDIIGMKASDAKTAIFDIAVSFQCRLDSLHVTATS